MRPVSYELRQALLVLVGALVLALTAVSLARRQRITLRYALGWLVIAGGGLVGALLTPLVKPISETFGMSPTGLLLAAASATLLTITVLLSVAVSELQARLRELAEAHALLANRYEELTEHASR